MLAMLGLSIAGNVAHTAHINTDPSARQYVYAIMWPVMVWLGVEMFVRVPWQPGKAAHWLVRWVGITLVAFIAGLVSYRHLRGLLIADGEDSIVYNVGPLAVDGLMLMATLALLLTRKLPVDAPTAQPIPASVPLTMEEELERFSLADLTSPAPVSPAPMTHDPATAKRERAPRASNAEREAKVRALLADPELKPAAGDSTMRRYARVARMLRDDPQADIDHKSERVVPEIVEQIIRPHMNLERVR